MTRTTCVLAAALLLAPTLLPPPAHAENAWVRGAPLNLRTGPGDEYRIIGLARPGDGVEVLERGEGWTRIRSAEGREGWIPEGHLDPEAPPVLRLPQLEDELGSLRRELDSVREEALGLRSAKESLDALTSQQEAEIGRLDVENRDLKAGARWPEWITGASILAAGMLVGAILQQWGSSRRRQPRLRF
jgi:SH3 domain protein